MTKHTYFYKDDRGVARISEVLSIFDDPPARKEQESLKYAVIRRRKGLYEVGEPFEVVRVDHVRVNDDLTLDLFQEGYHRD